MADLVALVSARLKAWPGLGGADGLRAVEAAAEFARLVEEGRLPTVLPAAFVLPAGETAGQQQLATGATRQRVTETVAVVLLTSSADRHGARGRGEITALRNEVRAALLGWLPAAGWTPMTFRRSSLSGLQGGAVALTAEYQSDTTITRPIAAPDPAPDEED